MHHADSKITNGRRSANGKIALRVPRDVITAKRGVYLRHGKPWHRPTLLNYDDYQIVKRYGAEFRGVVQYYLLAIDVWRLNAVQWAAQVSLLKTLAAKHQSTVTKMAARHRATIATPHGPRTCYEARVERNGKPALVARFGGIPLKCTRDAVLIDEVPAPVIVPRSELVARLLRGHCELCEEPAKVTVHQVRTLASLTRPGAPQPAWAALMASKRRKTLVVCRGCHATIHGRTTTTTA